VQVFDAAGFEIILIETVGAGQSEVEIASLAHTTIVVEAPGLGDEIQTIKAGTLEIADILVVNKADKPGADNSLRALRAMLSHTHPQIDQMSHHGEMMAVDLPDPEEQSLSWVPPVLPTISTTGEGIQDLIQQIFAHRDYLHSSGEWQIREAARLESELEYLLGTALRTHWESSISEDEYKKVLSKVITRKTSPGKAVEVLLKGAGI
ncbi:MAG: methylmalonyl Co-A mutase-associated GTPase MeaB, partial [Bacteroidetes bacterium]